MDIRWKRLIQAAGTLLILPGIVITLGAFCSGALSLLRNSSDGINSSIPVIISETMAVLTLGVGLTIFSHADQSLKGKPSHSLHLPPLIVLMGIFLFLTLLGALIGQSILVGLLFPPLLLLLAALPPLWAVSWFTPNPETTKSQLTWRRGLVAFCGGATVSVFLAIVLEILVPLVILSLIFNATHSVLDRLNELLIQGGSSGLGRALTDPAFIYLFIQLAIIAPLVEELVKPLVTLPLLRNLNRQEAFWVGALAGAGFAALENVIYAGSGLSIWAGILMVRALGGALHPLGSGLVTIGWRDVLQGQPHALEKWFKQYGLAVLIHAIWNGGSLLVVTIGGAQFFGVLPAQVGILGLSMAGTTLVFLLILGITALWIGRAYGHNRPLMTVPAADTDAPSEGMALSDRAVALWALGCLLAIVPMGIAGLRLWLR